MNKKQSSILLICCLLPFITYSKSLIEKVRFSQHKDTLYVSVHALINSSNVLDDAVKNGLIIGFNYEFNIQKKSWYSLSPLAKLKKNYLLSYQQVTAEYQVENPVTLETHYFKTLNHAIKSMQRLTDFPLIPIQQLPNEAMLLKVRFRLISEDLPTLIRLEKMMNRDWIIDSDWTTWPIP